MNAASPLWHLRASLCAIAMLWTVSSQAQLLFDPETPWVEAQVPDPPAYDARNLIPVEGPVSSSLTFGVDPKTITIGSDQVVRYVVVMQGPAARTAVYEGIRCRTGEKRVYARRNGDDDWERVDEPWLTLRHSSARLYALNLARDGMCIGVVPNQSVRDIVNALRSPKGELYR